MENIIKFFYQFLFQLRFLSYTLEPFLFRIFLTFITYTGFIICAVFITYITFITCITFIIYIIFLNCIIFITCIAYIAYTHFITCTMIILKNSWFFQLQAFEGNITLNNQILLLVIRIQHLKIMIITLQNRYFSVYYKSITLQYLTKLLFFNIFIRQFSSNIVQSFYLLAQYKKSFFSIIQDNTFQHNIKKHLLVGYKVTLLIPWLFICVLESPRFYLYRFSSF